MDDQARWPACSYSSDFRISDKFICQGDGISPANSRDRWRIDARLDSPGILMYFGVQNM